MHRKVTIKDIAKMASVSPTAVSMALNDRPGVSKKTRRRILKIAEKLGYQPNYIAKSLISNRSYTIGLILRNIADPFYTELALGIEKKATELGYSLLLYHTDGILEKETQAIETLQSKGVDGLIITTVTVDDINIKALIDTRFPFVLNNRFMMDPVIENKTDYVVNDNFTGGYDAFTHLYRLGHDRIAMIAGAMNTSTAVLRSKGARQALRDFDIEYLPDLVVDCHWRRDRAFEATQQLIKSKNPPTAYYAQDDYMALGVREALLQNGIQIPTDVALMGGDNIEMGGLAGVELSTMSQKKYEMGVMSVEILSNKIEKSMPDMVSKIVLAPELVIRKSCGYHGAGYVR